MRRTIALIFILISCRMVAQEFPKEFEIQQSEIKISNSLYNTLHFIDNRRDTSNIGVVQVGLGNNRVKVEAKIPLEIQLKEFLSSAIDSSAKNGELLLQVRHMLFAEEIKNYNEVGYFYLRANLYAKKNKLYVKLDSVDICFDLIRTIDVTNPLLKMGSEILTSFITKNLTKSTHDRVLYSYHELVKTDSIEKRKIKIYNINEYTNGLYYNYESFKQQVPDREVKVKFNQYSLANVKILDDMKNWVKIKNDDFYAFVYEGKPYISSGYGYYPIFKSNDDLYFVGKVKPVTPTEDQVMAATMTFGLMGYIIASAAGPSGETYFTIIDHSNGAFIPYKKMPVIPTR